MVFDDTADMLKQGALSRWNSAPARAAASATPCRIGAVRGTETLDKLAAGIEPDKQIAVVTPTSCNTMEDSGSALPALGGFTP